MFDCGLVSLDDDLRIRVSRNVSDRDAVQGFINRTGRAAAPNGWRTAPIPISCTGIARPVSRHNDRADGPPGLGSRAEHAGQRAPR
jgi:hypothetical protein